MKSPDSKVQFAIIGAGKMGQRHQEVIVAHPQASLAAIVEADERVRADIGQQSAVRIYASLDEMLVAEPDVSVVVVASPNGLHALQAQQCLKAGRHVVIEKPMALSAREAEQIVHCAFQYNRHVFVVMQNRYTPVGVWLKELVASGQLGRLYMVQVNLFWNRDERYYTPGSWHGGPLDGGVLFTQFSHFVDLLYWLWGDLEKIQTRLRKWSAAGPEGFMDSGTVTFDFVTGGMGCITFSTAVSDRNMESSLSIVGEHGSVKIGGQYMEEVQYCHLTGGEMVLPGKDTHKKPLPDVRAVNHYYVIDNAINVLQGTTTVATNAMEGFKVVDIIERIYKSNVPLV